ncbi:hypothetical protein ACFV3F_03535 [Streptomyces sp. NPDC059717]|uniref:hypothetical protein n=1 Tax=Streptomyces sp. NPDC059717 TaxID=3346922 RepID=UPI003673CCE0
MGKAFVAQLARKGARDPEALAAWIGRRKLGHKAFQGLAKAGRVRAEQHRDLMDRVRPSGRISSDLTGFSDDELGRSLNDLSPSEALRVAAELDRRDVAAGLPGARRDLIGLSDTELGQRAGTATGDELAAIAAEADRRQLVSQMFPDGRLASDLSNTDEEHLGWAIRYASPDEAERIAAEMDRRHPPAPPPAESSESTVEGQLADRAAMDELLGTNPDDWAWLSEDLPDDPRSRMTETERWLADREAEQESARTAYSRTQARDMYREHVWDQVLAAEEALNGVLLSRQAQAAGVDPVSLFSGPAHVAYARASEELKRWWQDHPRTTLAEYEEQLTGQLSSAAATARKSRGDQQNRL